MNNGQPWSRSTYSPSSLWEESSLSAQRPRISERGLQENNQLIKDNPADQTLDIDNPEEAKERKIKSLAAPSVPDTLETYLQASTQVLPTRVHDLQTTITKVTVGEADNERSEE